MEIKNLFESSAYLEIIARINSLQSESYPRWGKMNVAQMLAHCQAAFNVPLSSTPLPRMFLGRLLGWAIKHKLYDDQPWRKGLPTSPDFIIRDQREFEKERQGLLQLVKRFHEAGETGAGLYPHPFFGRFTPEQWGKSMWKHLDHHLRQFGV